MSKKATVIGVFLIPNQMSPGVQNCVHPSFNKVGHIRTLRVILCVRQHVSGDFSVTAKVSTASQTRAMPAEFIAEALTHLFLEPSLSCLYFTHTHTQI